MSSILTHRTINIIDTDHCYIDIYPINNAKKYKRIYSKYCFTMLFFALIIIVMYFITIDIMNANNSIKYNAT